MSTTPSPADTLATFITPYAQRDLFQTLTTYVTASEPRSTFAFEWLMGFCTALNCPADIDRRMADLMSGAVGARRLLLNLPEAR